jgi:hypothetical protein
MKRCWQFWLIFTLLVNIIFSGSALAQKQADYGKLDYSLHDAPLSYIDRPAYNAPSAASQRESLQTQKKRFDQANEYVQSRKAMEEDRKQKALGQLDDALEMVTKSKQQFDQSRKSYRYNNYPPYPYPYPYYEEEQFSTEIKRHPHPQPYYDTHMKQYSHGYMGYQPYLNIFNIPGYMNNYESYYDGYDNDDDNFIDEGFHQSNTQIILSDTGIQKDDEFELYIDGKYMGVNHNGKTRTWDINLYPGTHLVKIIAHSIPDNRGNYSIMFRNASVVSGPPMVGSDIMPGESLQWIIKTH